MKPWRVALVIALAVGALVIGVACGDGEDEEGQAGPTATAQADTPTVTAETPTAAAAATPALADRAELEALLKSMALALEDLPSGFTLEEEKFETNEEAAVDYPDGVEQGLANYARWGRLLGYQATYSTEVSLATLMAGGTVYIMVGTTLYEKPGGASEAMAEGKGRLLDSEEQAKLLEEFKKDNPSWKDPQFAPMSFADVGDDTFAYQLTGKVSTTEPGLEVAAVGQFVVVRRGRAIGTVVLAALQGPSPMQELEAMVRELDERMKDALE
jgi:hypothetical protein